MQTLESQLAEAEAQQRELATLLAEQREREAEAARQTKFAKAQAKREKERQAARAAALDAYRSSIADALAGAAKEAEAVKAWREELAAIVERLEALKHQQWKFD